ncbi:MAG: transporter substrate-binding domain-containing protein, partial [Clostridia bacterium]|nr:transporter substrate-binding domain-containing protein [Clostridia bacterium]
ILKKQTIVFGISPDSIPMSYVTMNDKTEGLSVDIGNELAKRLAVSAEFVFVEQEDALEALANEEIDCYLNLVSSDIKLASQMQTVDSGIDHRSAVVVTADSPIKRLVDLKGKTVCVVSGSDAAADFAAASVMYSSCGAVNLLASLDGIVLELGVGTSHAAVVDEEMFRYITRDVSDKYRFLSESVTSGDYVLAMRLRDTALSERIAMLYGDMQSDGTVDSIKAKWFG